MEGATVRGEIEGCTRCGGWPISLSGSAMRWSFRRQRRQIRATRRQMLSRTIDYLSKTIMQLPDFVAMRTTVQYDEALHKNMWRPRIGCDERQDVACDGDVRHGGELRYGKEVVDAEARKGKKLIARLERYMDRQGIVGSMLAMVFAEGFGDAQRVYLESLGTKPWMDRWRFSAMPFRRKGLPSSWVLLSG